MTHDDREHLYAKFLQHAVESAIQAIDEKCEEVLGRQISPRTREDIVTLLIGSLEELRKTRSIGTLDVSTTESIYASIISEMETVTGAEQQAKLRSECLASVRVVFANYAESLADFLGDIELERMQTAASEYEEDLKRFLDAWDLVQRELQEQDRVQELATQIGRPADELKKDLDRIGLTLRRIGVVLSRREMVEHALRSRSSA